MKFDPDCAANKIGNEIDNQIVDEICELAKALDKKPVPTRNRKARGEIPEPIKKRLAGQVYESFTKFNLRRKS